MKKQELLDFAKQLTNEYNIEILLQTKGGRWYEQRFTHSDADIQLETSYGVTIDGGPVDYSFKTGKREDTILKTFVTQYVSKHMMKLPKVVGDVWGTWTREECYEHLRRETRIRKSFFYTTLYGIGWFCFLSGTAEVNRVNSIMEKHLTSLDIPFNTEYSEARWVYRFLINRDVIEHGNILGGLNDF